MKLRGGLIQRNEGHFHLSSRKTTTYKELWLAAEIPRAEPGCIYFPPREKPFDVPSFYFFFSLFLSLSFCHRHDNARPRILERERYISYDYIQRNITMQLCLKYYKCGYLDKDLYRMNTIDEFKFEYYIYYIFEYFEYNFDF